MAAFLVQLDPQTAAFYSRSGRAAGLGTEPVLADALFKLAGELALEALHRRAGN